MPNTTNNPAAIVNHWGSHPNEGNDDHLEERTFATYDAALEAFHADAAHGVAWVELVAEGVATIGGTALGCHLLRANPAHDEERVAAEDAADDREWRMELANEAGMAFGCAGFNDAMGW